MIAGVGQQRATAATLGLGALARLLQQRRVGGQGRGLEEQRGIGRGVEGAEATDRLDVAGVGDHVGHGFQLRELVGHGVRIGCCAVRVLVAVPGSPLMRRGG
jgi:hypothetical protein